MSDLFRPCPFCGHAVGVRETFGKLVAGCENSKCKMKPDTWLHAGDIYDVRELARFWNSAFSKPIQTKSPT